METYSEFSDKPSSVSSEVFSKFIIMDYRTIFKKVLERLSLIPTDRQTYRQTERQINFQIYMVLRYIKKMLQIFKDTSVLNKNLTEYV